MLKKLLIAGLTASALTLGMVGASAPANAFIYFGLGGPMYGGPMYGGPGWHHHWHHWHNHCGWVWHHHHKHWVCW